MNKPLKIQEQINDFWKYGTYVGAATSLLFALLYWNISDPLWVGIYRLVAFIFFSFAVFGILKQLGGPLKLTITCNREYMLIKYQKKDKTVQKEKIELSTIRGISAVKENPPWKTGYLYRHKLSTLYVSFEDDKYSIPLFEHDGRTLFFDTQSIKRANKLVKDIILDDKKNK